MSCLGEERWTVKSARGLQRTDLTVHFNVIPSARMEFPTGCDVTLKHNEQKMAKVLFFRSPSILEINQFLKSFGGNLTLSFSLQYSIEGKLQLW